MVLGFAIVAVFAMAVVATIVATVGEQMKPQDPALAPPEPLMYEYPMPPPPPQLLQFPPPPQQLQQQSDDDHPSPSRHWNPYGEPYDDRYESMPPASYAPHDEDFDYEDQYPDGTVSINPVLIDVPIVVVRQLNFCCR